MPKEQCLCNCVECLEQQVHRRDDVGKYARSYDCPYMGYAYYCHFIYRYASELVCALRDLLPQLRGYIETLKVLSVGCGPCPELAALDFIHNRGELGYKQLEYVGVDSSELAWQVIWNDLQECANAELQFMPMSAKSLVDYLNTRFAYRYEWQPDILFVGYLLSDVWRRCGKSEASVFITQFAQFVNRLSESVKVFIIANDVAGADKALGGVPLFEELLEQLHNVRDVKKFWFGNGYSYGETRANNNLVGGITVPEAITKAYNSRKFCKSAQLIVTLGRTPS